MTKKQKAALVWERLLSEYPDSDCTLIDKDPFRLLVAVRLAAQCTDARVNKTTPTLFLKFPTVKSLAEADNEAVEEIIRPCGLYKTKARDLILMSRALIERFSGEVPDTMEELLTLPGVGRKSANLILGDIFGKPAIVCDTHCIRLSGRIGLTDGSTDPLKVERQLMKILDMSIANELCHRFVDHGRAVCTARSPKCQNCILQNICNFKG